MAPRGRRGSKRRRTAVASNSAASAAAGPSVAATERLKDPSHAKTLQSGLEELWRNGILCDLTIRLAQGGSVAAKGGEVKANEVLVHSAVVAALSKPLKKMLHGPLACVEDCMLTLQQPPGAGFDGAALRSLMEFMYTGELELTETTTWSLLSVADFFGIDGAKQLVVCFLVVLVGEKLVSLRLARQRYSLRSPLVRLTSGELADQVPASRLYQSFGVKHAKYPAGVRTWLCAFCHHLHTNKSRHSPTPSLQSSTRLISLAQIAWLCSQSDASRCAPSLEEPDRISGAW